MEKIAFLAAFLCLAGAGFGQNTGDIDAVLGKIRWLHHASILIKDAGKNIYIDPYKIKDPEKADLILITHSHHDHLSPDDIAAVWKEGCVIVCTAESAKKLEKYSPVVVKPGDKLTAVGYKCEAVPAYNKSKPFHPKKSENAGYVIEIGKVRVYHAGDTDYIEEMKTLKNIGIAFLPCGGTYTMDVNEAAEAVKAIRPVVAVPIHYGLIVGSQKNALEFKKAASPYTRVEILKQGD